MRKLSSVLLLLIISVLYISCSPIADSDGDLLFGINAPKPVDGNSGGGTTTSGVILKSITTQDPNGDPLTINFNYTGKQLTSVIYSNNQSFNLTYTDDKITKIVSSATIAGMTTTRDLNLVYTGNQLTKINEDFNLGGGFVQKAVTTVSYSGNGVSKIYKTTFTNSTPPEEFQYFNYDLTYSGINLSKIVNTMDIKGSPIPPVVTQINFLSFDAKKNPFYYLPKEFLIATLNTEGGALGQSGLSVNNFTKVSSDADSETYTYTYNSEGFPVTVTSGGITTTYQYY